MKEHLITLLAIIFAITSQAQQKIIYAGSMNNSISIVDRLTGAIEWQHPIGSYQDGIECNSVDITSKGNIVYAYKKGVKSIRTSHECIWDFPAPAGYEIHCAHVLPDQGILLALNGVPSRIVELDKNGNKRKEIVVKGDLGNQNPHLQFRQIRKSKNGNYLAPVLGKPVLYEINAKGEIVKEYPTRAGAFSVVELKNGNLLLPLGDGHGIQLLSRKDGKEISFIPHDGIEGCELLFVGEIQPIGKKQWMVANWSGHGGSEQAPQIIAFNEKGELLWKLSGKSYGTVSTIHPIKNNFIK